MAQLIVGGVIPEQMDLCGAADHNRKLGKIEWVGSSRTSEREPLERKVGTPYASD